ncbi:hypothetical protein D3C76_1823870 [compost metagenome]
MAIPFPIAPVAKASSFIVDNSRTRPVIGAMSTCSETLTTGTRFVEEELAVAR